MDVEIARGRSDEDPAQQVFSRNHCGRERAGGRIGGQRIQVAIAHNDRYWQLVDQLAQRFRHGVFSGLRPTSVRRVREPVQVFRRFEVEQQSSRECLHNLWGGIGVLTLLEAQVVGAADTHQRNAKLQLTVLLAPRDAVPELYLHPEHRRRRWRPALRTEFDV